MRPSNRRLPLALLYPEVNMDHIPTLELYQLRSGELDADTEATVRAHISSCTQAAFLCPRRAARPPRPTLVYDYSTRTSIAVR